MVAPEQQALLSSTHSTAAFRLRTAAGCATVFSNSLLASDAGQRPCAQSSRLKKTIDKIINKRNANIVSTINLLAQNGIVFGDISASSFPGSVTIDVDGSRTTTGGATVNSYTSATPARYEVTGDPNALYNISLPVSVVITSSADDNMVVDNFVSSPSASGQLDSAGRQNLSVGATMRVGSFQPYGAYTGVLATTVEYH